MAQFDFQYFTDTISPSIASRFKKNVRNAKIFFDEWDTYLYESGDLEVDKKRFAYMLATAWHETAFTFLPIREYGLGKKYKYGKPNDRGLVYYGRGYVQLTWDYNYEKMGKLLKIDLLKNPDLALDPQVAVKIMFKGFYGGFFTGRRLEQYFNQKTTDPINARRIINGVRKGELLPDKAEEIAKHYLLFLKGLKETTPIVQK